MSLPASGTIKLSEIKAEFGKGNNMLDYLGEGGVTASAPLKLTDFYGKSAAPPPPLPARRTSVSSMTSYEDMFSTPGFPAASYDTFYYQNDRPPEGPLKMGLFSKGYLRAVPPVPLSGSGAVYVGVAKNDFNRFAAQGINGWDFTDYTNFDITITTIDGFSSLFYVNSPVWSVYERDNFYLPYLSDGNVTGPGLDFWPYPSGAVAIGQALASNIDGNGTCNITINWIS